MSYIRSIKVEIKVKGQIISTFVFSVGSVLFAFANNSSAQELYRTAQSSSAQAIGGASVAQASGPMDAMSNNPAALVNVKGGVVDLGLSSVLGVGKFTNSSNNDGRLDPVMGIIPFGAVALPLHHGRLFLGAAVLPDTSMSANWHYYDSPGTAGADYGYQRYHSSILNLRSAAGLGYSFSSHLSVGATVGVIYNANTLQAPFIFQTQPALAGLKTLVNLHTAGTGWNGTAGFMYAPSSKIKFGASYRSRTVTHTNGTASGDLSAQLRALGISNFQSTYVYKANVDNTLPQVIAVGFSAPAGRHVNVAIEGDFVDWRHAFARLPVRLSQGSNTDLNSLVGSSSLADEVPLHWKDQGVVRAGVQLPVTESITIRGGYAFANDPVPSSTLTPLTAAITQQFLTTGLGYNHARWSVALAYEAGLPQSAHVTESSLLAKEYSNSHIDLTLQALSLTTSFRF